jgi:hypothetical protein
MMVQGAGTNQTSGDTMTQLSNNGQIQLSPKEFLDLVENSGYQNLVVAKAKRSTTLGGLFSGNDYTYITSCSGLTFFTYSEPIDIPENIRLIEAKKIWIYTW